MYNTTKCPSIVPGHFCTCPCIGMFGHFFLEKSVHSSAMHGHMHGKTSGRDMWTKTPRQPEGVKKCQKEWHELFLRAILESREPKAGARKVKIHDF